VGVSKKKKRKWVTNRKRDPRRPETGGTAGLKQGDRGKGVAEKNDRKRSGGLGFKEAKPGGNKAHGPL